MASPVHVGERATGYWVALLNVLFSEHVQSSMLHKASANGIANGNGTDGRVTHATASKKPRIN